MGLDAWIRSLGATVRHAAELGRAAPEIVFLNQRWAHHGRRSGYLLDVGLGPSLHRDDRAVPHPLFRWRAARTRDADWERRWLLWAKLAVARAKLVHVVDGDFDTWAYAPRPPWLRTRFTATFHQPADRLCEIVRAIRPGSLDGVLCMSRPQLPLLEPLVAPGRCVFLPHGVDTAFFSPPPETRPQGPLVLLCVGAHRRDFATFVAAARRIKAHRSDVTVRLVAPQPAAGSVRRDAGDVVEILSGISDEELRTQYRSATLLLLPLEAATANNALLEGMACGLPSVITDLLDLRDYATDAAAVFCPPKDVEAHADAALALLADPARLKALGRAAREQAESLSWPTIRARAREFFGEVIAGSR